MCFRNRLDIVGGKNMFAGDTKTQVWARDALPILVQRARAQEPRNYHIFRTHKRIGITGDRLCS